MTTDLKRLKPKKSDLNFTQGFNFGMGFMTAVVIFLVVIIPMVTCAFFVILAALGQSLTG